MAQNGYQIIEIIGGVKAEPSIIKTESTEEENAVEIGIDDIISSSDENIAHKTENVPKHSDNKSLNNRKNDDSWDSKDEGEKSDGEDFSVTSNIQTSERVILNFGQNADTNQIKKKNKPKQTAWDRVYKTSDWTDCSEDMKKIIVTEPFDEPTRVAPHDYTILTSGKYICNHCQREYDTYRLVKKHIRRSHNNNIKVYQCPYCPFKGKRDLQSHIISRHKDESDIQWLKCHLCDRKFKLKGSLRSHMRTHLTTEQMSEFLKKCSICGKGFRNQNALNVHIRYVHNKEPKKKIKCKDCEYMTPPDKMKKHVEEQHTDYQQLQIHSCDKCDYKTRYHRRFINHRRTHKSEYFCKKCAYITNVAEFLKLHQMTHQKKIDEKELKYRCDKCDYKTYRQYSLNIHRLNHLKPEEIQYFYCHHCSFKAKRKDNLKTHILKHFKKDKITLECFICEFSTKQRKSLTDHLEGHSITHMQPQVST